MDDHLTPEIPADLATEAGIVGYKTQASPHVELRPTTSPQQSKLTNPSIGAILRDIQLPERREMSPAPAPEKQLPAFGMLPTVQSPKSPSSPDTPASLPREKTPEPLPGQISSVHTMKTDLQDIVRETKMSLVRAASMEMSKKAQETQRAMFEKPREGVARKTILMVLSIIILLGLGGGAIFGLYILTHRSSTPIPSNDSPSVLFVENNMALALGETSPTVRQILADIIRQQGPAGSILQIIPTLVPGDGGGGTRNATLAEFFSTLGARVPGDLMRAVPGDFFLGIHMADVPSPVFIIPVSSYDRAFAGMLLWESSISTDLSSLFRQVSPMTTSPHDGTLVPRRFHDLIMRNYDVRVLSDDAGKAVLYYSFVTPGILIVFSSPYSFAEVLSRLQAERKL